MNNDNDIKEVMETEDFETPEVQKENAWTSIDLYYKGFHVKKSIPANISPSYVVSKIEEYIRLGFKPSWNEQTNSGVKPTVMSDPNAPICEVHNKPMTLKPAGVSKTTNKAYPAFWACSEKMPDGTFCRFRPSTNKV